MSIEAQIRNYLNEYLLFDDSLVYSDDDSFLARNLIDSTSVVELVLFVEDAYQFDIPDGDITPDHFDSVSRLAAYVRAKTTLQTSR